MWAEGVHPLCDSRVWFAVAFLPGSFLATCKEYLTVLC